MASLCKVVRGLVFLKSFCHIFRFIMCQISVGGRSGLQVNQFSTLTHTSHGVVIEAKRDLASSWRNRKDCSFLGFFCCLLPKPVGAAPNYVFRSVPETMCGLPLQNHALMQCRVKANKNHRNSVLVFSLQPCIQRLFQIRFQI